VLAFVDSSAWIAMLVSRDTNHLAALRFFRSIPKVRLVTSNYILAETFTWLTYHGHRRAVLQLNQMVAESEKLKLLDLEWVTPEIHDQAWSIFVRYDDQEFSFYDCTSFVICRRKKVDFVFGFDSDFRTMNFDVRPGP
jgi:predicted nucleic acid-binding protein